MKYTFSRAQKEKIKETQQKIASLNREMDVAYDALVKYLGFERYQEAYDSSSDLLKEMSDNPIDMLFDTVYNSQDEIELDSNIKKVELRVVAYHLD